MPIWKYGSSEPLTVPDSAPWAGASLDGWGSVLEDSWGDSDAATPVDVEIALEDVSLELSCYFQCLESLAAWLRAHDGVELEDIGTLLVALGVDTQDIPSLLQAYYQYIEKVAVPLSAIGERFKFLTTLLSVYGCEIVSARTLLSGSGEARRYAQLWLHSASSTVLTDYGLFLDATSGGVTESMSLRLSVRSLISISSHSTYQRMSAVITKVI